MDKFGQLRLKTRDLLCLTWNDKGQLFMSPHCKSDIYAEFKDSPKYPFIFNMEENAIVTAANTGAQKSLGVVKNLQYGPMKLFKMTAATNNPSIKKFYLTSVIYMSESPSSIPSNRPSQSSSPSQNPSQCKDEPDWVVGGENDYTGLTCTDIAASDVEHLCQKIEEIEDSGSYFKRVRRNEEYPLCLII